tara:strand:- start:48 stop:446 length:399 start_codon:yes stop_codon:yes gene_type:complete
MENYLYFAGINGGGGAADGSADAGMYPVSKFCGVEPVSATTTNIYFKTPISNIDEGVVGDILQITHADTHATAGSYHRCKIIAQAIAEACNAGPHAHGGVVTVFDADNDIYFGGIADIKGDAGFDIVITLDT